MIRHLAPLKTLVLKNFLLKVTSLFLAMLLWIALNGEPRSEIGLSVPVEYRNAPPNVELLGQPVNSVDVRLSAPSSIIRRLDTSRISAVIDLSRWDYGERTYSITTDNIEVPLSVTVNKITPGVVRINFQPTERKTVEVRPRIIGKPADGFQIRAIRPQPDRVQIEGPKGHVSEIGVVSTDSIDVSGKAQSFSARVHLYIEDAMVRFATFSETTVEITIVPIEKAPLAES